LQGEFTDISQLAGIVDMLQKMGPDNAMTALSSAAAQYAQQSLPDRSAIKRPESDFVMHVMPSGTSFSFD
jgi:hypothetical protein